MQIRVDDYRRPSGPSQCSVCQRFNHEQHCANYKGCSAYKKESRRHLPPQVRKAREQQSRRDIRENRRAATQPAPQQQPPPGFFGPPGPQPWGPPRHHPPPGFTQFTNNRFEALTHHGVPSYNELDFPVVANNPWQRRPRQKQPKKNWAGHKNGNGKQQQQQQQQQPTPAFPAAPAAPAKEKPAAAPRRTTTSFSTNGKGIVPASNLDRRYHIEKPILHLVLCLLLGVAFGDNSESKNTLVKEKLKAYKFPPCRACKILATSFQKQMDRTSRGKFEGGDTAWEEEKLGTYARSEVRLIEIQEKICADVKEGEDQCLFLAEENEHVLEDWFFHKQLEEPDVLNYLCINTLKVCCPDGTYGVECKPCPGFPENVCNKCGKCQGSGTRKGNGKCVCDDGYSGDFCSSCAENHFESYRDKDKLLCSPCHTSCSGTCTQAGTKGCIACKPGWLMDTERGCVDVNECLGETSVCKKDQFCINTEGSYSCLECDKSCASCQGDGPDMCEKCAEGYTRKDNFCIDEQKLSRDTHVNLTRYLTYFGLCIATCIIFQKNPLMASIIGLCVALYISISEYMVRTMSEDNGLPGLDVNKVLGT
ncbi:protein disulfide isomerase crld-1 [Bacillus rossius redtenbacheri]|uniref:protein disulfide isomerase crld-1 n=1 Tax=Bacillus rossius redtenbacheri TaxID=93214 RepID=UPI002FDE2107